jgi:flavin reductase (DIM6/NTAB) family NADH-FMN oxidoreductase RutF
MSVRSRPVALPLERPIWERVFTVAPLVIVGTREPDGSHDLAPKHMAMPLGWENRYGFVCTPRHATYANAVATGEFTVSFPRPEMVVTAGLAATSRAEDGSKPILAGLPTFPAAEVDGVLVEGCYLFLECRLERVVDGLGEASLLVGEIVAASVDEAALRVSDGDDASLVRQQPLLAYVHPGRFAPLAETYSFPFPADFRR